MESWDLAPYQGPGQASPGALWQLYDAAHCVVSSPGVNQQVQGTVDAEGRLVGLPAVHYPNFGALFWWDHVRCVFLRIGCHRPGYPDQWPDVGCVAYGGDNACQGYEDYFQMAVHLCGDYMVTWQEMEDLPPCPE